jgi:Gas vesicle synthesis protein GvpO
MADRTAAAARRAEARARRRTTPAPEAPPAADEDGATENRPDARQAAKAAAAAAMVGAAVGTVRALASRGDDRADGGGHDRAVERPRRPEDDVGDQSPEAVAPEHVHEGEAPQKGVASDRLRDVTTRARRFLQELSGAEPESVSAIDRTAGGWRVTVEVVEVHRIPESTDVLATYEVELDRDGDLVRYERRRRYYRSQSDTGGGE